MSSPKYPNIKVELSGGDGNAFAVLGKVKRALQRASTPQDEIDQFMKEATSGDYNHLLATAMEWVDVE